MRNSSFAHTFTPNPTKTLLALTVTCALLVGLTPSSIAQSITVPNGSFESPEAEEGSGVPFFADWQENPEPPGFDPEGGLDWAFRSGVFRATGLAPDGVQAAYLFTTPGIGISQELSQTYEPGLSYNLTVGVHPGLSAAPTIGNQLRISLSYDNAGTLVPIESRIIEYDPADFPPPYFFFDDFSVTVLDVDESAAWAGQNITVEFEALSGDGSGTWDLDNVRLTVVPEPSTLALLAVGLGLGCCVARSRRKA